MTPDTDKNASGRRWNRLAADIAVVILLNGCAVLLGFALFVLAFRIGLAGAMGVLFFRGLVLAALAFVATFGLFLAGIRRWRPRSFSARDAFSAAVLSLSFNVCFLVVVPVTVDRSISVFVLGEMAANPDRLYSSDEMSQLFTKVYVGDYAQIDRRMREQTVTGNVEQIERRYRLSVRGQRFIQTAKLMAWLFGGDPRFASPPAR